MLFNPSIFASNFIFMKQVIYSLIVVSFMFSCAEKPLQYPPTKKGDVKDIYFGTVVEDPYRWLEDDNSPETAEWVKTQNQLTFDYLAKLPHREEIKSRLTGIYIFISRHYSCSASGAFKRRPCLNRNYKKYNAMQE